MIDLEFISYLKEMGFLKSSKDKLIPFSYEQLNNSEIRIVLENSSIIIEKPRKYYYVYIYSIYKSLYIQVSGRKKFNGLSQIIHWMDIRLLEETFIGRKESEKEVDALYDNYL